MSTAVHRALGYGRLSVSRRFVKPRLSLTLRDAAYLVLVR